MDGQKFESVSLACGAKFRVFSYQKEVKDGETTSQRVIAEFAAGTGMTAGIGFVTPIEARMMAKILTDGADFAEQQEAGAAS